jgi:RHS repeat-associated protein
LKILGLKEVVMGEYSSSWVWQGILFVFLMFFLISPPVAFASSASNPELGVMGATWETKSLDVGDPVSASNGAFHFQMDFLSLGGPMDLSFTLYYNSIRDFMFNRLPRTFWWNPQAHVLSDITLDEVTVATAWLPNGDQVSFQKEDEGWVLAGPSTDVGWTVFKDNYPRIKYQLREAGSRLYLLDPVRERLLIFKWYMTQPWGSKKWTIDYILDRNGNRLAYTYSPVSGGIPIRVEDGLGRSLDFTQKGIEGCLLCDNYLNTVTDQTGRQVVLTAEKIDGKELLTSVTDPQGHTTTFGPYTGDNFLEARKMPLGNVPYRQTYGTESLDSMSYVRVTSQQDAYDNSITLDYSSETNQVTANNPDETSVQFQHYGSHGLPKSLTDPTGNTIHFEKNIDEHITGLTDRLGDVTGFSYHAETGKPASITNAKGNTISYTYTAQDQAFIDPANEEEVTFTFYNLTKMDYPDGTSETFIYDVTGNVHKYTDRAGNVWTYSYNSMGQVLTGTNPAGGVVTNTYNDDGTMASQTDSDTGTTIYEYDGYKRLSKIVHPDESSVEITYDLNDRVTSITDENSNKFTYDYDENGNLLAVTDPKDEKTQYAYDLMDRVVKTTGRLNQDTLIAYDSMGRIASATDPNGLEVSYGYDPRGWENLVTIGGKSWHTEYDDEGVVSSTKTPLENVVAYETDKLGFTKTITDPLDQKQTFSRDQMNKITGITDPLNRTTTYAYDDRGLLAGVTTPVLGTITYKRNKLGLLDELTDLNGNQWTFGRTNMGRPGSVTDPLSQTSTYGYDTRGRLSEVVYADSSTMDRTYDHAGNMVKVQYGDALTIGYSYDQLNRLLTADGVSLTRDPEGRVIATENPGTVFSASYDDGGRLITAGYNNDSFTVTYTYDQTSGLLSKVIDDLTGTQVDFIYDDDQKLTGITRSNQVDSTYSHDNAGRLTRIEHGTIIDLKYVLDAAGQVTSLDMTVPLDPGDLLEDGTAAFTYDAASQVSTAGYEYDPRGRLTASPGHTFTWDGASRLTGVNGTTLSYNGLGDVITSGDTRYYYNYALGEEPIVAEKDEATGQFLRYYVWTPGGALLYMIDAAGGNKVYFHHFDRTGSTLALTDSSGTVTDTYAYSPYGELLGHNGSSTQPFTFVGEYGVRREDTGGALYHMRARYYDAAAARFISREPLWPQLWEPKSINPYQYALLNPVSNVDLDGLETRKERTSLEEAVADVIASDPLWWLDYAMQQPELADVILSHMPPEWTLMAPDRYLDHFLGDRESVYKAVAHFDGSLGQKSSGYSPEESGGRSTSDYASACLTGAKLFTGIQKLRNKKTILEKGHGMVAGKIIRRKARTEGAKAAGKVIHIAKQSGKVFKTFGPAGVAAEGYHAASKIGGCLEEGILHGWDSAAGKAQEDSITADVVGAIGGRKYVGVPVRFVGWFVSKALRD